MRALARLCVVATQLVTSAAFAASGYMPELHVVPVAAKGPATFASWEGKAHIFAVSNPHPVQILFFHDAGLPAFSSDNNPRKNPLVKDLATALKAEGVTHPLHSMPWESNPAAVQAWLATQRGPIIVAGQNRGGTFAAALAERYPDKVKAALVLEPQHGMEAGRVPMLRVPTSGPAVGSTEARAIKAFLDAQLRP